MASYNRNSAIVDIVHNRTSKNDQFDVMIDLLREVAVIKPLTGETWRKRFDAMTDKLETKKQDIKDPEVKKLIKNGTSIQNHQ